jgi:excisionase family DNA binding protein
MQIETDKSSSFKLLTAKQTSELLQVTLARVYDLAREGLIPCVRLGRQLRFDEVTLREWVSQGGSTEKRQRS